MCGNFFTVAHCLIRPHTLPTLVQAHPLTSPPCSATGLPPSPAAQSSRYVSHVAHPPPSPRVGRIAHRAPRPSARVHPSSLMVALAIDSGAGVRRSQHIACHPPSQPLRERRTHRLPSSHARTTARDRWHRRQRRHRVNEEGGRHQRRRHGPPCTVRRTCSRQTRRSPRRYWVQEAQYGAAPVRGTNVGT